MNTRRFPVLLVAAALLPAAAQAQSQAADPAESVARGSDYFRIQSEMESWRAANGPSWQVVQDEETGWGRFLYGGSTQAVTAPRTEADFVDLARSALQSSKAIHGMELSTLVLDRVVFLPLGNAGSTDKMTVNFHQEVNGVRVLGGHVSVLFDMHGRLLSVDSTGLPGLGQGFSTSPALEPAEAADAALAAFSLDTGLPPTAVDPAELVIEQFTPDKYREPRLAWQVEVRHDTPGALPEGYAYRIDALNGHVLSKRRTVHDFDVSGTVRSMATPGQYPDTATNPEVQIVMPYLRVTSSAGNAVTDSNGNFTIVGASAPLQVTVTYNGTYCTINNQAQTDYTLTTTLNSASGNSILMNPSSVDLVTPEANGINWIGQMRDWTRSVNPADATSDFLATCNVNLNSTCNAYYDGVSVNFYRAGGGCVNTGYSNVILHEMGHWLNDKYGSGNGSDGFGEGNADNFATYISDDPIVGHDFCGTGCNVRDGNNTRQFCGDCCGGCYGEVHADGEVLMGAMWKVRARLKATLGSAAGIVTANTLFNGWMNAYNDTQIKTIIETHWLTLDDNDGNINNGTPHYDDINNGFKDQGFPGYQLSFVIFNNVTVLGNTTDEAGPYLVDADITAAFNPPISSAFLHYRVDGSSYNSVPMNLVGGNTYRGAIPGQVSPAKVEYYLSAQDGAGKSNTFPDAGAIGPIKFYVGILTTWFSDDFEGGVNGWTHAQVATQDDWQRSADVGLSVSAGKSGDPTTAPSGTNIWGNDLGPNGWNGAYADNVSNYLRSPSIDLSQATGTMLTFKRWLTVEKSQYDKATVKVNGQQVYINPVGQDLIDSEWHDVEIDISAIADGNPAVQIEFGLVSDGGVTYGGWNLDDVAVVSLLPVCPAPLSYCTSKLTSTLSVPTAGYTGSASQGSGNFVVTLTGAVAGKGAVPLWSANQAAVPFSGGFLCVGAPITRGPLSVTNASGSTSLPVTITPAMVGTTRNYQWWFRDPNDAFGVGLSDGLSVVFCN